MRNRRSPLYVASDYQNAMLALMPRGRAWSKDPDSVQSIVFSALSRVYERSTSDAINLLTDAFPVSAVSMLPEWEATLGLPDICDGIDPAYQARQSHVVAKFAGTGGQSIPYLSGYASKLGYTVTTTEFSPFRFGRSFGQLLNGDDWAYALQINAPLFSEQIFSLGSSGFGEPFASWSNATLECVMREIAPAHAALIFSYS